MTDDLARVTRMAEECGGRVLRTEMGDVVTMGASKLLAFEKAVLATKQDALERKCITANEEVLMQENAELKRWNANLKTNNFKLSVESQTILEHCKDLERIIAESQTRQSIGYQWTFDDGTTFEMFKPLDDSSHYAEPLKYKSFRELFASPVIQEGMQLVQIELNIAEEENKHDL